MQYKFIYRRIYIYIKLFKKWKIKVSYGIIKEKKNEFKFSHLCCIEKGSSSRPILNLKNNKIIGIFKGGSKVEDYIKVFLWNLE